jgi:hypothetical protein
VRRPAWWLSECLITSGVHALSASDEHFINLVAAAARVAGNPITSGLLSLWRFGLIPFTPLTQLPGNWGTIITIPFTPLTQLPGNWGTIITIPFTPLTQLPGNWGTIITIPFTPLTQLPGNWGTVITTC